MTGISKPLRGVSFNAQWPGFSSTRLKALAWPKRMKGLVSAVAAENPDVIIVQEMGKAEASVFFAALQVAMKRKIGYDRSQENDTGLGLNCVAWCKDAFTYESSQNLDLADYGQYPGRSAIVVKLLDKTKNRLRIASGHNPVKTKNDAQAQQDSVQKFVSAVNDDKDDWPMVWGIDSNNRQSDTQGMWSVAKKYGYSWKRYGIDAVLTNFGAQASNFKKVDLKTNSDHDMLVFDLKTNKK